VDYFGFTQCSANMTVLRRECSLSTGTSSEPKGSYRKDGTRFPPIVPTLSISFFLALFLFIQLSLFSSYLFSPAAASLESSVIRAT
jgi:hypothetical protein